MTTEDTLDSFLSNYRLKTTVSENTDIAQPNIITEILISLELLKQSPVIFINRGAIPYFAPTEDMNRYTNIIDIQNEYAKFAAGTTYLNSLNIKMIYDMNETKDSEYGTIPMSQTATNRYGAFKILSNAHDSISKYPYFYSLNAENQPHEISSYSGVTARGASAGCYTLVNFGGIITPFQLMNNASTLGLEHVRGLPIGTGGNPLYFGLTANTGITSAMKSMYYTPDIHTSLRRNLGLYLNRGISFSGILANFEPHYQFIKFADDAYLDTQTNQISQYSASPNPGWLSELLAYAGSTGVSNRVGYQLASDFNNRFLREIQDRPIVYNATDESYIYGHYGLPYATEVLGWSSKIPTLGIAIGTKGSYALNGKSFYINRIAGLTLYPPPTSYNYLGITAAGVSGGMTGWNSYRKAIAADTSFYNEYFMLGGTLNAASLTYAASNLIPANILKLFNDSPSVLGPTGKTMNMLDSYYYDLYKQTIAYGVYRTANVFPINFIPRFNPYVPIQNTSNIVGTSESRSIIRNCTIHSDFGGNTAERLYNLKQSMRESIQSAIKIWKLTMDEVSKFDYRILPVIQGRSEDYDLTRGGSVPYTPSDFVEYLVKPLFDTAVPANGFILKDNIEQYLLEYFYNGNIARGSAEYSKVITGGGISGADVGTSFIRGLETYFFDLEECQINFRRSNDLSALNLSIPSTNYATYLSLCSTGRLSEFRIFETNTGSTGGNTIIPYGKTDFNWYLIPLNPNCIIATTPDLNNRWNNPVNNNNKIAYEILKDAYFELTKQQLIETLQYFATNKITTFGNYRSTDKAIGR